MAWHAPCVSQGRESVKGVSDVQPVSSGHTDVTAGRDGRPGRSLVVVVGGGGYGDAGLTGDVGVGAANRRVCNAACLLAVKNCRRLAPNAKYQGPKVQALYLGTPLTDGQTDRLPCHVMPQCRPHPRPPQSYTRQSPTSPPAPSHSHRGRHHRGPRRCPFATRSLQRQAGLGRARG